MIMFDELPRDILTVVISYQDQYDLYYPLSDYKKYLVEYTADKNDTDDDLKEY